MKTVVYANQKGGVGKSAVLTQQAHHLSGIRKLRVLVMDFDHQRNSSKAIRLSGLATVSAVNSVTVLTSPTPPVIEDADFVLIEGDPALILMEKQGGAEHNKYVNNLHAFLASVSDRFDVCLIDTNPNPDIRQLSALCTADYVLSPIQLNQEAIDGIGDLLNHPVLGIRNIQASVNPNLKLIGILPNLVEPTPFQKNNFHDLATHFPGLLISMAPEAKGFAAIKKTTAIAEAQAAGVPVWKHPKTSGRTAWLEMKPVFDKLATIMEVA